jgi:hypothetical protein
MKTALKLSIVANIGLTGVVLWLMHRGQTGGAGVPIVSSSNVSVSADLMTQPVSGETPRDSHKKFQWNQLESPDYRAYIANLRAVGCPKQTIRDIITADVDSLYAARRQRLAAQVPDGPPLVRANAQQALDSKLNTLYDEEASVLTALLSSPQDPAQQTVADNTVAPARTQRDQSQDNAISVPLVFQQLDPAALKLNDAQLNDLAYLRQKFQEDVGGPDQNPNDPAYLKRWQAAQPQNDRMLRAMLGNRVYDQFEKEAESQAPPTQ